MLNNFKIQPNASFRGNIRVPGDKSISHRAVMLGSLANGVTEVTGFLAGEDCLNTVRVFQDMGVQINNSGPNRFIIHGVGLHGLKKPEHILDLGNSGTSIRLLTGILAAQPFDSILTGDASLQKRPMQRVAEPLTKMGAHIELNSGNVPPIRIFGNPLHGARHTLAIASAQVKSCLLLAGLYAAGETEVTEPAPTRDHTERMLQAFGYDVTYRDATISIKGGGRLTAIDMDIPADISSAAFFMVGASIAAGSEIVLQQVGINPRRTGIINILRLMGADIVIENERTIGAEPVADIRVCAAKLHGIVIPTEQVPLAIDEFPAIFIAAACANGVTTLKGAEELRHKESDRIAVMAEGLSALGIDVQALPDGIRIVGGKFNSGKVNSHGDHRIAMAFAMAGAVAQGTILIEDCVNVATSFPGLWNWPEKLG